MEVQLLTGKYKGYIGEVIRESGDMSVVQIPHIQEMQEVVSIRTDEFKPLKPVEMLSYSETSTSSRFIATPMAKLIRDICQEMLDEALKDQTRKPHLLVNELETK